MNNRRRRLKKRQQAERRWNRTMDALNSDPVPTWDPYKRHLRRGLRNGFRRDPR